MYMSLSKLRINFSIKFNPHVKSRFGVMNLPHQIFLFYTVETFHTVSVFHSQKAQCFYFQDVVHNQCAPPLF